VCEDGLLFPVLLPVRVLLDDSFAPFEADLRFEDGEGSRMLSDSAALE
jgi:hypothetical protein